MFERGLVQIAGIHDRDEASLLEDLGVAWLGFPLILNVHKEDCTLDEARTIIAGLKKHTRAVTITYETNPKRLVELNHFLKTEIVQIHAPISLDAIGEIKRLVPNLKIIKSLIIVGRKEVVLEEARRYAPHVDAFLTDTYDPATGASGATGKIHDWSVSRMLVEDINRPLILAGGLNPDNVSDAIHRVKPFGVDCHTGVEGPDGRKDPELVQTFLERTHRAYVPERR